MGETRCFECGHELTAPYCPACRPAPSPPEDVAASAAFLNEAARYFENCPAKGEDRAFWATVHNAENCRKAAALIQSLSSQLAEANERYAREAHAKMVALEQLAEARAERDKQKDRLFRQIDFTGELQRLLWALSQGNDIPETIKDSHAYKVASIVKADRDRLAAALRSIAEGNLGDDPWQAGYAKIKEVARAALASPTDADAAVGWRSMDSAPKDGTAILGWNGSFRIVVHWNIDRHCWWGCGYSQTPTHWMPLPAAPLTAAKAGEDGR